MRRSRTAIRVNQLGVLSDVCGGNSVIVEVLLEKLLQDGFTNSLKTWIVHEIGNIAQRILCNAKSIIHKLGLLANGTIVELYSQISQSTAHNIRLDNGQKCARQ
jgi:hypothetical protein